MLRRGGNVPIRRGPKPDSNQSYRFILERARTTDVVEVLLIRLVFGICSVRLPAPLESRTNEKVALDSSSGGIQPLILELRYALDGTPLIETATVRLLSSGS